VGLCFLNDLFYLFSLPNFYKYLGRPVLEFIQKLNYFEEDAKHYSCIDKPHVNLIRRQSVTPAAQAQKPTAVQE
jgi:hypothetical protein